MKRSLFIAIVVLLMAALFVSCNAEKTMEDQLVEVSVAGELSRALSMTAEATNAPVGSLYWYYTAEKKDSSFKTGETRENAGDPLVKTAVQATTGLVTEQLGPTGLFSKGVWEFKFYGYDKVITDAEAKLIYSAETTETLKKSLSLSLTLKAESVAAASIYIENVTFTSDLLESVYDSVKLFVNVDGNLFGAEAGYEGTIAGTTATFAAQAIRLDANGIQAGTHQAEFVVKGYIEGETEPDVIGRYPTSAQIVEGMKYTISGSVDAVDITGGIGVGNPEVPATTSERVTETLSSTDDVQFVSTNTPAVVENTETTTTVTFPQGSFTAAQDNAEAVLTVTAYNAAAAQGNFQVQGSDNKPIAGLDLSLTGATSFNGKYAEVTTFIGEGYVNPTVVYDGEGEQPIFVSYVNGYITFKTSHFSSFYIFAAEARIGNVAYATLREAIEAVPLNGTEPTEIELLRDVENARGITVAEKKNFVLDFGGHTYSVSKPGAGSTGTETQAFQLLKDSTIVFKNGTITIAEDNLTPAVAPAKNIMRIIQNYADLTLEDMYIDGSNQYGEHDYIVSFNNGNSVIKGNTTITSQTKQSPIIDVCQYATYPGVSLVINTTGTIDGDIELSRSQTNDTTNYTNSLSIEYGTINGKVYEYNSGEGYYNVAITGGTFAWDPTEYLASGFTATEANGSWTVSAN